MLKGRKKNYTHNTALSSAFRHFPMINGQGLGDISKLKYGLCHMSFNGCEVISVYNALVYLGIPQPINEIALFLERYRVLMGVFGCSPYKLGRALEKFGAQFEKLREVGDSEAFIVSFWTGRRFMSSIHTVFCVRTHGGIKVYNRYNNCPTMQLCRTMEDVIGKKRPIAVYRIIKP